jgi:putative drug exporter of the RND superfamily
MIWHHDNPSSKSNKPVWSFSQAKNCPSVQSEIPSFDEPKIRTDRVRLKHINNHTKKEKTMKFNPGIESLARAAARRPWVTVGIWIAVLAAALVIVFTLLGGALTTDMQVTNNPESQQAQTILDQNLGQDTTLEEMIIIRSKTLTVDDAEYRQQVEAMFAGVMALGKDVVIGGMNYYLTGAEALVSADRHSTFITITMPEGSEKEVEQIYSVTDPYAAGGTLEIFHTGDASFTEDTTQLAENTMKTGESIGVTVALVVLAIVFGALAAAFFPIALGIVAIIAALGLTALVGQFMDLTFTVTNMITMMGLAVGIDYSLFILTRFREERAKGLTKIEAIARTGATANKAVLFSGITVILALAGLIIFPMSIFKTMGIGAVLVVFVAVAASITLLPALLSLFGDKVNSLRIPFIQRRSEATAGNGSRGFWARTTRIVTRFPVVSLVLAVVLLALAAMPYLGKNTGMSGISGIPDDLRAKQGFLVLQQEFHLGMDSPALVVVQGDVTSTAVQNAITSLQARTSEDAAFTPSSVSAYPEKNLAVISIGMAGDPLSKEAMDAVERLRATYLPEAFASTGIQPLVTGETAFILDFNATTDSYTPLIFAFILSLSFVILTLAFRSIVIPATAIVMNLLSVAAAYGLMVLVFQRGVGASIFGFQQVDVIETWLPLFLFAMLFGLSMDYQVFLLSRIRERFRQTGENSEAVSFGLLSTGKLITGAALIMVAVFGGFALGDMVMFQQMGFGLAVAVFLDATLVRSVLVPAAMKLLGKYNWYLPKWLAWLPNISLGETEQEKKTPARPALSAPPAPRKPLVRPIPVTVPLRVNQSVRIIRRKDMDMN